MVHLNPIQVRTALIELPLVLAQEDLTAPPLEQVFIPQGHLKALSLDSSVVVGMRGSGKSYWTAVLSSTKHRSFVASQSHLSDLQRADVKVGFGQDESNKDFPNSDEIARLLKDGLSPERIWMAVVLRHSVMSTRLNIPYAMFENDVVGLARWVNDNPEKSEQLLREADEKLSNAKRKLLVLFDAFDRLAYEWKTVRELSKGALRFGLRCRSRKAVRLKFFLRPDIEEDDEIWGFADSSKLRQAKVELNWRAQDLYGLLLQHLANSRTAGPKIRSEMASTFGVKWTSQAGLYAVPDSLRREEPVLRETIEAITGKLMGRDPKRGYAYTWIPLHLADAKSQVSPRSMLLAFQRAAQWTLEHMPDHSFALHYQGIQVGVAEASRTRTNEIQEDYPWVKPALEAARDLQVPCTARELTGRWKGLSADALIRSGGKLPPRRFSTDPYRNQKPDALIDDLIDLAVLYRTEDNRLNMPDIFRVGVGIKRKGGVRPIR